MVAFLGFYGQYLANGLLSRARTDGRPAALPEPQRRVGAGRTMQAWHAASVLAVLSVHKTVHEVRCCRYPGAGRGVRPWQRPRSRAVTSAPLCARVGLADPGHQGE